MECSNSGFASGTAPHQDNLAVAAPQPDGAGRFDLQLSRLAFQMECIFP